MLFRRSRAWLILRNTVPALLASFALALVVYALASAQSGDEPAGPTLARPADGASTTDITPTFAWSPVSNAVSYTVQIAADAGFAALLFQNDANPAFVHRRPRSKPGKPISGEPAR